MNDCPLPRSGKANGLFDSVSYAPYPHSVPRARRRVAALALAWGCPGLAGNAGLVASELCTNAVLHGCLRGRLFRVETSLRGGVLRVAVTDPRGERLPQVRDAGREDAFGRGLFLVAALADRWSAEPLAVGKTVWAEFRATDEAGPRY
ncbi:ATP-binding protein [Streptomyces sp. NPDC008150]|uniref:ATP-binding protein n=1 Tax=Streptomyces sp. NPDC008150 TaxID=3364816 RepID=UPI0036F18CC1